MWTPTRGCAWRHRSPGTAAPSAPTRCPAPMATRSEEHTSELQSQSNLVCRLLLEKKKSLHTHSPSVQSQTHGGMPSRITLRALLNTDSQCTPYIPRCPLTDCR